MDDHEKETIQQPKQLEVIEVNISNGGFEISVGDVQVIKNHLSVLNTGANKIINENSINKDIVGINKGISKIEYEITVCGRFD